MAAVDTDSPNNDSAPSNRGRKWSRFFNVVIGLAIAQLLVTFISGSWPATLFLGVMLALLLTAITAVAWVVTLGLALLTKERPSWRKVVAAPLIGLLSLPLAFGALPLRFRLVQGAFNEYVETLELVPGEPAELDHPDWIGSYRVGRVWTDGESVFFRFAHSGFIDGGGVAYVPDGRVIDSGGVSTSRKLSGPWQSISLPF